MKKVWAFLFTLLMLVFPLFSVSANAEEEVSFEIRAGCFDDQGEVPITVSIVGGRQIQMIQFVLRYDADEMDLLDAIPGDILQEVGAPTFNTESEGYVYFVWDSLKSLPSDGVLMTLMFCPVKEEMNGSIFLDFESECIVADENFSEYSVHSEPCNVVLDKESTLEGNGFLAETDNNPPVSGVPSESKRNDYTLLLGQTIRLSPETGSNVYDWTSSNEAVAIVKDGDVIARKGGTAVITAFSEDGTESSTYIVRVESREETQLEELEEPENRDSDDQDRVNPAGVIAVTVGALAVITVIVFLNARKNRRNYSR